MLNYDEKITYGKNLLSHFSFTSLNRLTLYVDCPIKDYC